MELVNKYSPLEQPVLVIGIGLIPAPRRFRREPNRQ